MIFTEADVARFMTYVDKLPCGCWFYTGARSRGGGNRKWYGTFWLPNPKPKGQRVRAHRFSAVAIGGQRELEPGEHWDHTCVFSLCVHPDHTEIVTHEVNQERKVARKRGEK
jgi:hypothetical protein